MLEIKGQFNTAKVFTENIEEGAIAQIKTLCDLEFVKNSKIRIMPDVHSGAGCTIGTTITIQDKIIPNMVGVDIGCGMEVIQVKNSHIELEKLDKLIYSKIPSGFDIREIHHRYNEDIDLNQLRCKVHTNLDRAKRSIGTLGGGNHFIEVNQGNDGCLYIVVHSGSRHLGHQVATYYQNEGYSRLNGNSQADIAKMIAEYKATGREKEIQSAIKEIKKHTTTDLAKPLAYVEGDLFDDYLHDMKIVQYFATLNRKAIIDEIINGMKLKVTEQWTTIHNYINTDEMLLRKGAVSAQKGEKLLIPINMHDGSLICVGKGNEDWNNSAPHGAGRIMSRTAARNSLSMSEFKEIMKDIYTTSVNKDTLDECPLAYKPIDEIVANIGDTVDIIDIIKPIYNFKAVGWCASSVLCI